MPKLKYIKNAQNTNTRVNFKYLNDKNEIIKEYFNEECFRVFSYNLIPKEVKKIIFFKPVNEIPYNEEIIANWIKELNDLGFSCSFEKKQNLQYDFIFNLEDYKSKLHFVSAAQLVRCLSEQGICYIPEIYFRIIEANKKIDKFIALQRAHFKVHVCSPYFNTNHMVTSLYDAKNKAIERKEFFKRIDKYLVSNI